MIYGSEIQAVIYSDFWDILIIKIVLYFAKYIWN